MRGKHLAVAATACCGFLLAGSTARAEFNQRLTFDNTASAPNSGGLSGGVVNQNLLLDDTTDAENEQIWRRGWGGGWGGRGWGGGWGWRGGWGGGWRGGWGWNNSWAWRGGWGGWNNSWAWRGGWGSGWNGGWGWGGPVTTYYYSPPVYYSSPLYYYYPSYSWCPITLDETNAGFNSTLQIQPRQEQNVAPPAANQQQPNGNSSAYGTYPYNGGPSNPVPMPQGAQYQPQQRPAPATQPAPQKTVPLEGIPISLPGRTPTAQKYAYPAYGETPGRTQFAEDRPIVIRR